MKHSLKKHMIDHFLAPALAVSLLGGFGAVCIGFIHRFSYGFLIFVPLTGGIIFLLFFVSLFRGVRDFKRNNK